MTDTPASSPAPIPPPHTVILALLNGIGAGGGSIGQSGVWNLSFSIDAWRLPDSPDTAPVLTGNPARTCYLAGLTEDQLKEWMAQIPAHSIVEFETGDASDFQITYIKRILRTQVEDPELIRIDAELKKPLIAIHPRFGELTYNRSFQQYEGKARWPEPNGQTIKIILSCPNPEETEEIFAVADRLFAESASWDQRIKDFAVQKLLTLKNDAWLGEDEETGEPEAEFTSGMFLGRMTLESIEIDEFGEFTFWNDDGDLFFGHAIQINGSLDKGPTDADIPG